MADGKGKSDAGELEPGPTLKDGEDQTSTENARLLVQGHYSGPLPPPAHLEHYEHVLPGAAERIFNMTETEQRQRHSFENFLGSSSVRDSESAARCSRSPSGWVHWRCRPIWSMPVIPAMR